MPHCEIAAQRVCVTLIFDHTALSKAAIKLARRAANRVERCYACRKVGVCAPVHTRPISGGTRVSRGVEVIAESCRQRALKTGFRRQRIHDGWCLGGFSFAQQALKSRNLGLKGSKGRIRGFQRLIRILFTGTQRLNGLFQFANRTGRILKMGFAIGELFAGLFKIRFQFGRIRKAG